MARHVILTFEDNTEAEEFVKAVQQQEDELPFAYIGFAVQDSYVVKSVEKGVRVLGLFAKPTAFCECPPSDRSVRGSKFGLWVHQDCAKPKRGVWQYPRNLLLKLTNKQLKPEPGVDLRYAWPGFQEGIAQEPELINLNAREDT